MNVNDASDSDLVRHFAATADQSAFTELVNRHAAMVWRTCRRLTGSHHDAEDAFQAVFALLSERASQLDDHQSLGGWLHRTAWHLAAKQRRNESRLRRRERRAVSQGSSNREFATVPVVDENDFLFALQRAIEALPPEYREALVLHHLQEQTLREISEVTGSPIGTVAARVSRARGMLRDRLADWGMDLNPVAVVGLLEIARRRSLRRRLLQQAKRVAPAAPAIELVAARSAAVALPATNMSGAAAAIGQFGSSATTTLNGMGSWLAALIQTRFGGAVVAAAVLVLGTAASVGGVNAIRRSMGLAASSPIVGVENAHAETGQQTDEKAPPRQEWSFKWLHFTDAGGGGAVPEPTSATLSGGAAAWLLMRRRSRCASESRLSGGTE